MDSGLGRKARLVRVELVLVVTLILILVGIAQPRYVTSISWARKATLKQDCFVMRNSIQQYTLDKDAAPASIDDLVQAKYLSAVPTNPFTHEKLSLRDCVAGPEEYIDPVQTIPGFRRLYSYSADTPAGGGTHTNE